MENEPQIKENFINNQMKLSNYYKLSFWWIVLTIVYIVLLLSRAGPLALFIGMFVPVGPFTLISLLSSPILLIPSFGLIYFVIFRLGSNLYKWGINKFLKLILIFLILLFLTMALDLFVYGTWQSLNLLEGKEISGHEGW